MGAHVIACPSEGQRGSRWTLKVNWKRSVDAVLVEIGAIDNLGVQLDASYGLLLNLLPNLPADAERRPLKQRKVPRHRTATR